MPPQGQGCDDLFDAYSTGRVVGAITGARLLRALKTSFQQCGSRESYGKELFPGNEMTTYSLPFEAPTRRLLCRQAM